MKQNIIDRINHLADEKEPFLFVVNYAGSEAYIRKLSEIATDECLYDFEGITNISILRPKKTDLELAEEDKAQGRVTQWNSVDEMFDTVLGE